MSDSETDECDPCLRVHSFVPSSKANGPGKRAVLWVKGCSLGCSGCFNPETHAHKGGKMVPVSTLVERLRALPSEVEGLTISGGEPFQQRGRVLKLLKRVRTETSLSSIVFTGYAWNEVQQMPEVERILSCIDVLIAGRYEEDKRLAEGLRGSANKTIHFLSNRYGLADFNHVPEAEVLIDAKGRVTLSGIDPLKW